MVHFQGKIELMEKAWNQTENVKLDFKNSDINEHWKRLIETDRS